jgi:hypothetical protein
MKLQFASSPIITSDNMDSSIMGIDASGMDQACFFLRDKIYSDKIRAVVREYTCNALDEHIKYDIKRPVEIGIRKEDDSNFFFVRDFAKGLSEHDVRNIFGKYFKSTKRNNNIQSGSFGLGAKSAHSYTDTFYVKSYHNGKCTLYACALGGGGTGVPVGHILKVSESPTQETGLEVYLEIKISDVHLFNEKSIFFVQYCTENIVFKHFNILTVPLKPVSQIKKNGFTFRFFEDERLYRGNNCNITMGNVTYKSYRIDSFLKTPYFKQKFTVLVDVPIGTMTLPISRENFENNASNNRVISSIETTFTEIAQEEINSVKTMTLEELIKDRDDACIQSEHFESYKRVKYKDVYSFVTNVFISGTETDFEKFNDKPLCGIIKSRNISQYWKNRFEALAIKNGKKYYLISSDSLTGCDMQKINEIFEIRNVKSSIFGWSKTERDKASLSMETPFTVHLKGNYGSYGHHHLNALGVYNYICSNNYNGFPKIADSVEQAKEFMSKITFDSLKALNFFTVKRSNSITGCATTVVRSKTMYDNLISLGFLDAYSQEYKDKFAQISKIESEKIKKRESISSLQKKFLHNDVSNSLMKKAERNSKFGDKANHVFNKIVSENSIRGKILQSLQDSSSYFYSKSPYFSRKELRTILRLK